MIALDSPLGRRVLAAGGRLESGFLADMNRYRAYPTVHVRLLGEDHTLCGRGLYFTVASGRQELAWHFVHRGYVASGHVPSGAWPGDRNACRACAKSPVLQATVEMARTRMKVLRK